MGVEDDAGALVAYLRRADLLVLLGTPGLSRADRHAALAAALADRTAAEATTTAVWDRAIDDRDACLARLSPEARHWLANYSAGIRPETALGGPETALGAPNTPRQALGDAQAPAGTPDGCEWDDGNGVTVGCGMITRTGDRRYAVTCDTPGCEAILLTDAGWVPEARAAARANGWTLATRNGAAILPRLTCPRHGAA